MRGVYLAKENEGSIIEVRRHGRRWITTDGRCTYQDGSFEWVAPLSRVLAAAKPTVTAKR